MKVICKLFCFMACIGLVFGFGFLCGRQAIRFPDPFKTTNRYITAQQTYIPELENCIRNIGETQQQLIDAGFKDVVINGEPNEVTVDYIWGPITERAYGNYMATKSIERMAEAKK